MPLDLPFVALLASTATVPLAPVTLANEVFYLPTQNWILLHGLWF